MASQMFEGKRYKLSTSKGRKKVREESVRASGTLLTDTEAAISREVRELRARSQTGAAKEEAGSVALRMLSSLTITLWFFNRSPVVGGTMGNLEVVREVGSKSHSK